MLCVGPVAVNSLLPPFHGFQGSTQVVRQMQQALSPRSRLTAPPFYFYFVFIKVVDLCSGQN